MKLIRLLTVMLIGSASLPVYATSLYTTVSISQFEVDAGSETAKPYVDSLRIGYQFAEGLALEAQMGTSGSEDNLGDGKLKVDNTSALFLRMGGSASYNDVKLYLLVGRAKAKFKYDGSSVTVDDKYQANLWGIGAEENSRSIKNMAYVLEYMKTNENKGISITGITLGLRYNFF